MDLSIRETLGSMETRQNPWCVSELAEGGRGSEQSGLKST
jgi:hypothetical protein